MAAPALGATDGHAASDMDVPGLNPGESTAFKKKQGTKEIIMLKDSTIMAVLPAKDINRAKDFYRDKLGLESSDAMEEGSLMYRCGNGTSFLLYQTDNAGSAKNTQMGWETDNLEAEMEDLRGRGVTFEDYDMPGLKTENGVSTNDWGKSAWFLDSEGNILNLSQRA
ncbi:putative enzyme related to lactoylglutathione lyase [Arthrobacter sp. UYCo732]